MSAAQDRTGPGPFATMLGDPPAVAFDAASASPADLRLAEAFLPNLRVVPPGDASLDALDALEQTAATLVSG